MISIFITIFIDLVGFGMFIPILPQIARSFHATDFQVAMLAAWYSLASFLSVGLIGYLSDIFGRKKIILATIALSCIAQMLTGFANSYIFLVVTKILAGIASGNLATAQACISDITSKQDRGRHMAIIGLAFGGGFSIGPAIGTISILIIDKFQLFQGSYIFGIALAATILNLFNFIFIAYKLPETHYRFANVGIKGIIGNPDPHVVAKIPHKIPIKYDFKKSLSLFLHNGTFIAVIIIIFLQVLSFTGVETLLPLILKDAYLFSDLGIYKSYIFIGITSLFANAVIARNLLKNSCETISLKIGQFLLILSMIGIPLCAPNPQLFFINISFLCVGIAVSNPSLNTLVSTSSPPELQGFAFGISQTISSLARVIGPPILGITYQNGLWMDSFMKEKSLYISAIILLTGFLVSIGCLKNTCKGIL
jgi:MFS transporter, DHA1 family, tetracycline resistance protein